MVVRTMDGKMMTLFSVFHAKSCALRFAMIDIDFEAVSGEKLIKWAMLYHYHLFYRSYFYIYNDI